MVDELRVTVVATGLDGIGADIPLKVVESRPIEPRSNDYRKLDRPTVMRNSASQAAVAREVAPAPMADKDMEYLDIPAFLRRQAD